MADQNQNKSTKVKSVLDDPFLRLTAPCPVAGVEAWKKSNLRIVLDKFNKQSLVNPHMVVYTNDPSEKDRDTNYGKITAKFDSLTWFTYMELFHSAIDWEPGKKSYVDCKDFIFPGGQRSKEPVATARVIVGKDKAGVLSVCIKDLLKPNRAVIVFKLMPPAGFHDIRHGDETPYDDAELSKLYAKAYYKRMTALVEHLLVTNYTEPPPPENRNGGGNNNYRGNGGGNSYNNGGGNNGGGGGGGNRAPAADSWDGDVDF
jgi:uncharacterized membrane protein YgcG